MSLVDKTLTQLAAFIQAPKRADLGYKVLYLSDLNVTLPNAKPNTPQVSFTVSDPPISGDTLRLLRRYLVLTIAFYNASGTAEYFRAAVDVNGVSKYSFIYPNSYGVNYGATWRAQFYVNPGDVIDVYAWCNTGASTLRWVSGTVLYVPKVSSKLCSIFAVSCLSGFVGACVHYGAQTTPSSIGMAHDDVVESSAGVGFTKLTNVAAPSFWLDEVGLSNWLSSASGTTFYNLSVVYPAIVVWTE
jgi:hypothetical protein